MPVSSWSTTASANTGILSGGIVLDGSVLNVPLIDDSFRDMAAQIAVQLGKLNYKGSDMPSAATVDLSTASGWYCDITGSTTITAFGTVPAGVLFILRFAGALTLTHNASTLILPGGVNIAAAVGDVAWMVSLGSGAWRCISYVTASVTWQRATDGTMSLYSGSTRVLIITPTGDLHMKGDVVSDYAGV
jgi:hypothetical protein